MQMKDLNEISGNVVDSAVHVHKELGPGLLERIYEDALAHELTLRNISFERQKILAVPYKGIILDTQFRLDLIIEDQIIVELKNCDKILPVHEAQILTYLKITERKIGLLLNFNAALMKQGIKRVVL